LIGGPISVKFHKFLGGSTQDPSSRAGNKEPEREGSKMKMEERERGRGRKGKENRNRTPKHSFGSKVVVMYLNRHLKSNVSYILT